MAAIVLQRSFLNKARAHTRTHAHTRIHTHTHTHAHTHHRSAASHRGSRGVPAARPRPLRARAHATHATRARANRYTEQHAESRRGRVRLRGEFHSPPSQPRPPAAAAAAAAGRRSTWPWSTTAATSRPSSWPAAPMHPVTSPLLLIYIPVAVCDVIPARCAGVCASTRPAGVASRWAHGARWAVYIRIALLHICVILHICTRRQGAEQPRCSATLFSARRARLLTAAASWVAPLIKNLSSTTYFFLLFIYSNLVMSKLRRGAVGADAPDRAEAAAFGRRRRPSSGPLPLGCLCV